MSKTLNFPARIEDAAQMVIDAEMAVDGHHHIARINFYLCHTQMYFLNVAAVIAMVTPSSMEQGRNTNIGLIEKGRDK